MVLANNYEKNYNSRIYDIKENEQIDKITTEKSKSSKDNVQEYYESLCKKFPGISFNTNGGELRCSANKVVVNLSYDCLKKMANDPEFAKKIEWNLSGEIAANTQVYSFAKRDGVELGGRTVTYDADGNRQSSCGGMKTANNRNSCQSKKRKRRSSEARLIRKRKEKLEAEIEKRQLEKKEYLDSIGKMYLEGFNCANDNDRYQNTGLSWTTSLFDVGA